MKTIQEIIDAANAGELSGREQLRICLAVHNKGLRGAAEALSEDKGELCKAKNKGPVFAPLKDRLQKKIGIPIKSWEKDE